MLIGILALSPGAAAGTHCDAKPFTLTIPKPAPSRPKAVAEPAKKIAQRESKPLASKPKPKPLADCKDQKK